MITDKKLALNLVNHYPYNIELLSEELKNDKDIVIMFFNKVKLKGGALEYVSENIQNNKKIILQAIKNLENTLQYALPILGENKKFILGLLQEEIKDLKSEQNKFMKFLKKT